MTDQNLDLLLRFVTERNLRGQNGFSLAAKYVRVEETTVHRWLSGEFKPKGETSLRLRTMLDLAGLKPPDFNRLPVPTRDFATAIALGLLTVDEATNELDYTNTQDLYRVILRGSSMMTARVRKMETYLREHRSELDGLAAQARAELTGEGPSGQAQALQKSPAAPPSRETPPEASSVAETGDDDIEDDDSQMVFVASVTHSKLSDITLVKALVPNLHTLMALLMEVRLSTHGDMVRKTIIDEFGSTRFERLLNLLTSLDD